MYKFNFSPYNEATPSNYGWNQFVAFVNGKSTLEVWNTLPVEFMFSWGFFFVDVIELLKNSPGIVAGEHVLYLSNLGTLHFDLVTRAHIQVTKRYALEFALDEVLEGAIVPDAPDRIGGLMRATPFRTVESWWIQRYQIPKTSPMDLLTEAIRLGDMTTAKTAWEEVTADARKFNYFG